MSTENKKETGNDRAYEVLYGRPEIRKMFFAELVAAIHSVPSLSAAEPAQPSEPAKCPRCGKLDHEDGGCYIDDDVSHEACSECGRSFGDLAEMADTGKCVDCAERPSSEPAGEVTTAQRLAQTPIETIRWAAADMAGKVVHDRVTPLGVTSLKVAFGKDIARATEADKRTIADMQTRLDALAGQVDAMRDVRDRSNAAAREKERAIAELEAEVTGTQDRLSMIIDEAFGTHPVMPTEELLASLERGLFELRQRVEKAETIAADGMRMFAAIAEACAMNDETTMRSIADDAIRALQDLRQQYDADENTIAELRHELERLEGHYNEESARAEAAQARVRELEAAHGRDVLAYARVLGERDAAHTEPAGEVTTENLDKCD